jgi:hypothetical protein
VHQVWDNRDNRTSAAERTRLQQASIVLTSREADKQKDHTMGIRETLNQKPQITTGITIGIIVVALVYILWQSLGGSSGPTGNTMGKAFFSVDEGKTWFADDATQLSPFQKDGKEAVRVHVWTCDNGKTKFASHLERFTPEARKKLEELRGKLNANSAAPQMSIAMDMDQVMQSGMEVKRVGDANAKWVRSISNEGQSVQSMVKCPGSTGELMPWTPDME